LLETSTTCREVAVGQGAHAIECLIEENDPFFGRIDSGRREQLQRGDSLGTEARIDTLNQHKASHEQPRTHGEHQSRRHFQDHEHAAHASTRIASSFLQCSGCRRPRELNRRRETGEDCSQDDDATCDNGGAGVNGNAIDTCDVQRPQSPDHV
jgi:hypothetical protein